MRRLLTTTTALLALAATAVAPLLATAPADAAETIAIKPASLPRGPDIAGPHLDGTTIVDGDVSVKVKRPNVILYGKWHDQYVAATGTSTVGQGQARADLRDRHRQGAARVHRPVHRRPRRRRTTRSPTPTATAPRSPPSRSTTSASTRRSRSTASRPCPTCSAFGDGLAVASFGPPKAKTITWNTVTNDVVRVNTKQGNYASVAHDLLGYYSKDPQRGGCQVLAHLSDPGDVLWTSCDERIDAVSPDGKRVATIPLLTDGLGSPRRHRPQGQRQGAGRTTRSASSSAGSGGRPAPSC